MPQLNNIHWTDDEDLLERFVLNRLEADERKELEAHLRECPRCRQTAQAEQQVVAGIRWAGRDALKARLKERVGVQPLRHVNWYQVAGVAAMIVLLVAIGLYNRWFFKGEMKEPVVTEQWEGEHRAPVQELKRADKDEVAATKPKTKEPSAISKPVPARTGAKPTSREEARRDAAIELSKVPVEIEKQKGRKVQAEPLQVAAAAPAKKEVAALGETAGGMNAIWIEGTLLPEGFEDRAAPQSLARRESKRSEQLQARKMNEKISKDERQQMATEGAEPEKFVVTQRSPSALLQSQRAEQQGINTIQTLVERKGRGLQMTLYFDPPVKESALRDARVESVTEDSIIVNIGPQRIGYKLPPGWSEQAIRQLKQKK
jgi:hypothetical protein